MFLKTSLEYCQFTNISSSVLQKNTLNWKQLSLDGAYRVLNVFMKEDADVNIVSLKIRGKSTA